jgi:hypothetical protein
VGGRPNISYGVGLEVCGHRMSSTDARRMLVLWNLREGLNDDGVRGWRMTVVWMRTRDGRSRVVDI